MQSAQPPSEAMRELFLEVNLYSLQDSLLPGLTAGQPAARTHCRTACCQDWPNELWELGQLSFHPLSTQSGHCPSLPEAHQLFLPNNLCDLCDPWELCQWPQFNYFFPYGSPSNKYLCVVPPQKNSGHMHTFPYLPTPSHHCSNHAITHHLFCNAGSTSHLLP